jgi:hypothetical protein
LNFCANEPTFSWVKALQSVQGSTFKVQRAGHIRKKGPCINH